MSNFEYYKSKLPETKQRAIWIRESLKQTGHGHKEIKGWVEARCTQIESKMSLMDKLIKSGRSDYIHRLKPIQNDIETTTKLLSTCVGILARESAYEKGMSKLINRICQDCEYQLADFLVTFSIDAPAVLQVTGGHPIFYAPEEAFGNPYNWLGLYHEVGHIFTHQFRREIIGSLIEIVQSHYAKTRIAIGPVERESRMRMEDAIHRSEEYWTKGQFDVRLEELFCDCFATYVSGIAYLFSWLDYGVSFVDCPQFVDDCDNHPPFSARFEACHYILPPSLRGTPAANLIDKVWMDYARSCSLSTNATMGYSTVCNHELVHRLAVDSIRLIETHWPNLKRWVVQPSGKYDEIQPDEPVISMLNKLIGVLVSAPQDYRKQADEVTNAVFNKGVKS